MASHGIAVTKAMWCFARSARIDMYGEGSGSEAWYVMYLDKESVATGCFNRAVRGFVLTTSVYAQ